MQQNEEKKIEKKKKSIVKDSQDLISSRYFKRYRKILKNSTIFKPTRYRNTKSEEISTSEIFFYSDIKIFIVVGFCNIVNGVWLQLFCYHLATYLLQFIFGWGFRAVKRESFIERCANKKAFGKARRPIKKLSFIGLYFAIEKKSFKTFICRKQIIKLVMVPINESDMLNELFGNSGIGINDSGTTLSQDQVNKRNQQWILKLSENDDMNTKKKE
ncbi:hypothetical protein RFI_35643 [Reticulomyxa filosa]|uniref:Transmembrane protein n=1 Tax=Reticulomyxa filosa TaxID=46433 RepID=X6LKY6_RETFI|nr:hypothetical protein RFI_35643 [Reticulomyxa filosa]|eukprot:ETO01797.1 hypothetical protein RFI_35643 [Reticulomyxa filosa]